MKKSTKKLALDTQTVRPLTTATLAQVPGAGDPLKLLNSLLCNTNSDKASNSDGVSCQGQC